MGIVLFDCKSSRTTKNDVNNTFSKSCLFDGYLTEPSNYPHFEQMAYLTGSGLAGLKTYSNALFARLFLFDAYLTELAFKRTRWFEQNVAIIWRPNRRNY